MMKVEGEKQRQREKDDAIAYEQTIRDSIRRAPLTGYQSITSPPDSPSEYDAEPATKASAAMTPYNVD